MLLEALPGGPAEGRDPGASADELQRLVGYINWVAGVVPGAKVSRSCGLDHRDALREAGATSLPPKVAKRVRVLLSPFALHELACWRACVREWKRRNVAEVGAASRALPGRVFPFELCMLHRSPL